MASHIERGESIFIPFRDGQSILDSQLRPRMYKTTEAFQKKFPRHYMGTEGIELVEYAPVAHGRWVGTADGYADGELVYDMWECSECGYDADGADEKPDWNYCPNCGAKMDGK